MTIPNDSAMLLSLVNMHLRDNYPSLEEFCKANALDMRALCDKLASIGYTYKEERNQFV